jgi:hypothetical protein
LSVTPSEYLKPSALESCAHAAGCASTAAGVARNIFSSTLQDIQEQEAVILRAMLRPEKLLHFLRPGRLVSCACPAANLVCLGDFLL